MTAVIHTPLTQYVTGGAFMTAQELLKLISDGQLDEALNNVDLLQEASDVEKLKIKAYIGWLKSNQTSLDDTLYSQLLSKTITELVLSRFYTTDILSALIISILTKNDADNLSKVDTYLDILKRVSLESYIILLNQLQEKGLLDKTKLCSLIKDVLQSDSINKLDSNEAKASLEQLRIFAGVEC